METSTKENRSEAVIGHQALLAHWQGHRSLTRRVIEAFPEEALFKHQIGGMRPFSAMVMELLGIAGPGMKEMATGVTISLNEEPPENVTKADLLAQWDTATEEINRYWAEIPLSRFEEKLTLFGQYEGTISSSVFYFIDNEIHHRGQGYVYLRNLGIEPPAFYER